MMMAVATMLCICKHNDNDDADDGNGDDNLLQGGEQSSSVRVRGAPGQGWIRMVTIGNHWDGLESFSPFISIAR